MSPRDVVPERKRPAVITVLAILHLVGGGLGLLSTLSTIAMQAVAQNRPAAAVVPAPAPGGIPKPAPGDIPDQQQITRDMMQYFEANIPNYQAVTYAGLGISLFLDVLLLAGGVGLLKMRPWGRTVSLVYAPLSIVNRTGQFIYAMAVVMPATRAFLQQAAAKYPALASLMPIIEITTVAGLIGSVVVIAYPIAVLIILLRSSVAAAFRGGVVQLEDEGWPERAPRDSWGEPPDALTP